MGYLEKFRDGDDFAGPGLQDRIVDLQKWIFTVAFGLALDVTDPIEPCCHSAEKAVLRSSESGNCLPERFLSLE
ncbi:hypothetical protein D3C87_1920990 [compost metagenome]